MREQERLRNRQAELENMRNRHSQSQLAHTDHQKTFVYAKISKKPEEEDFYEDEQNTNYSNDSSDEYYQQNYIPSNSPNNKHPNGTNKLNEANKNYLAVQNQQYANGTGDGHGISGRNNGHSSRNGPTSEALKYLGKNKFDDDMLDTGRGGGDGRKSKMMIDPHFKYD